jgi:hypothetical protein
MGEVKIIMLDEICQSQKDRYHVFSHMWNLVGKVHEGERETIKDVEGSKGRV